MGNCWGSSAENPSSSADTRLSTTGTSSQSTSTMTMTTTSAGSSISPISRFSASSGDETSPHGQILPHPNLRIFTFAELKVATKNFKSDSLLGEGGFGKVFKGWLEEKPSAKNGSGLVIAVKRLKSESAQGFREWQAEIDFLGRLSHPNLVKLIGYCLEETELLLVYEFMQKGSLENHLFGRGAVVQPLQWSLRLKIAVGAARGLAFLHTSEKQVIYRDFKASNILLDGFYNAKISDFGLAKIGPSPSQSHVSTRVMGTQGYAAPEYIATGHLYVKSDVFGFGVVLVEILTGLRAVDTGRTGKENLVEWVKPYLSDRRKLKTIMDAGLQGKYPSKIVYEIAQLALTCLEGEPKARPSMEEVVKTLETLEAAPERSIRSRNRSGSRPAAHRHVQHQHQHQHQLPLPLPPPSPMQPRTPLHPRHNGFSAYQQSPQLRQ